MIKWLLILLACLGTFVLLNAYLPSSWKHGLTVQGYFLPVAGMILAGVVFLGYRLKG